MPLAQLAGLKQRLDTWVAVAARSGAIALIIAAGGSTFDGFCQAASAAVIEVDSNKALKAQSGSPNATVRRLGFAKPGDSPPLVYSYSTGACSAADNGAQVSADDGGCWSSTLTGVSVTPMDWGCAGNGVTNDTACVQAAITASAAAGVPLHFDAAHLYNITAPLDIANPLDIEGPYRYGIWAVNQPTGSGPETCSWGLVTRNTGITMLNASAITGTIRGLCIDMTGDQTANPTSGAAISITPPDTGHYSSGWTVEYNTILQPNDGIAAYGTGIVNVCCGKGTAADGVAILRNTIISPAGAGISIGKHHTATAGGPGTVGITITDNDIVCKTPASSAQGIGVALYEGAIWYDGTQNGPEGCHIGTLVAPSNINGVGQAVQLDADGVLGDQSGLHDFYVHPNNHGVISYITLGGKAPWASATSDLTTALIDCTDATVSCQNVSITGAVFHGGNNLNVPILDIEGGAGGPYNVSVIGSQICPAGNPIRRGSIGIKLNAGSGATGRWIIANNLIGVGCPGGQVNTGISLTINTGSTSHGSVTITGNDISTAATPISYIPNSRDSVIIANNMGLDDHLPNISDASEIDPGMFPVIRIIGTGVSIRKIGRPYRNRSLRMITKDGPVRFNSGAGSNLCGNFASSGAFATVDAQYDATDECWILH